MTAEQWREFRRTGTVQAERLDEDLTWVTESGDQLTGRTGDWRVTDGRRTWTVGAEQFRTSYEADGEAYRRCGVVRARPGTPGEVVATLEGEVRVQPGDWVVEGTGGERWPVPGPRFAESYEPVERQLPT